jgi:thermostable 8-oxoguanine DNA glycosylase
LQKQYKRQFITRQKNTAENITLITRTAFAIKHDSFQIESELRINSLCVLFGVGVPVASAILTICYPKKYAVIDYRNWRQIYDNNEKKNNFTIKEYLEYLDKIVELSIKFKFTPQEIDLAIWTKDKLKPRKGVMYKNSE